MNKILILLALVFLMNTATAKTINCLVLNQKISKNPSYTVGCIEGLPCLSYDNIDIPRDDLIKTSWFTKRNILLFGFGGVILSIFVCIALINGGGNTWIKRD